MDFPSGVEQLYKKLNSFSLNDPNNSVLKLTAKGKTCGLVHSKTASVLENYPDVFIVADKTVSINPKYQTCDEITEAVRKVILDIKSKNIFSELNGWRNEEYNVKERFSSPEVLFRVERAASSLLGIKCYGSHINGYIKKDGKYYLWIARRSKTKPTFPGMLDNFSAGGLTAGLSPIECARKELEEEAGVGHEISSKIKMVDAITYAYSKNEYVHQEAEFVFDIKLPVDFKPVNTDGEVGEFYLMDVEEAKKAVIRDEFKPNSAAVTLNFLMRKGLVTSDELPNYLEILENFHVLGY